MRTVVVWMALLAGGCLESQGKAPECGDGQSFAFGGAGYCVYRAAIIIEGFDCPPTLPFRHDSPEDGLVVCSATDETPVGGWDDLIEAWKEENGGTVNADASSEVIVPEGPKSACEATLDGLGFGALVVGATDSGCTVVRQCGDGVVASCDHGALACDCPLGELRCVERADEKCPPYEASLDQPCVGALGEEACGEGLFCDAGTCKPVPPVCAGVGCYARAECDGACAGEDEVSGVLGRCVDAVEAPGHDCWDPKECPAGWLCQDVLQPCAACGECADYQVPGQCTPADLIAPGFGLVQGVGLSAIGVFWAYDYALVDCTTLIVEVRDEETGEWTAAPDVGCAGVVQVGFAAASPVTLTVPVPLTDGFDYVWVRATATMLRGCAGAEPETCSGEPVVLTAPATVLR